MDLIQSEGAADLQLTPNFWLALDQLHAKSQERFK
jgi:hypothetical protein